MGRDGGLLIVVRSRFSFNPRARMGRDPLKKSLTYPSMMFQSTRPHGARRHTPNPLSAFGTVSIHAPAWGATGRHLIPCSQSVCFNPRARMGRDLFPGAGFFTARCFNPRARMGRDESEHYREAGEYWFQSTRPHGARPQDLITWGLSPMFQSTRPHGARRQSSLLLRR